MPACCGVDLLAFFTLSNFCQSITKYKELINIIKYAKIYKSSIKKKIKKIAVPPSPLLEWDPLLLVHHLPPISSHPH